jgi:hypothetical protein
MDVVGQQLVGDHEQERVRQQDEQEAGHEHERQAQRGQHGRQQRVEDRDQSRDDERGPGALEPDARHQHGRHPDRGRGHDPGDHQPQRAQPRRGGLPADLLAVRRCAGGGILVGH